jgi:ABC-type nitrate/sulfonate/bicarbonate transport system substrate-binding protein
MRVEIKDKVDTLAPNRRSFLKLAGIGGTSLLTAGLWPSRARAATRSINLFMGTSPDHANIWVAHQKGFFAAENLEAKIRLFPSGSAATDAFRAGVAEFVACGDIPAMRLWEVMGTKYIAPVAYDYQTPVFMVKSAIMTVEDLRGKTIATRFGSTFELMIDMMSRKLNIPAGTFKVINMEPNDMVITLDRGDIDGFIWGSPMEARSKQISGNKVRLFVRGKDVGFPNVVCMNTRADLIKNDPALVQDFVRAQMKASDWCMANKEETSEIVAKAIKLEPEVAKMTYAMDFTTKLDQNLYPFYCELGKFVLAKGIVKKLDWKDFLDTSFMKKVDPTRVGEMTCS